MTWLTFSCLAKSSAGGGLGGKKVSLRRAVFCVHSLFDTLTQNVYTFLCVFRIRIKGVLYSDL